MTPPDELLIGAHTSIAGGVHNALLAGKSIGATTIQIFTANQRRWLSSPIKEDIAELWHQTLRETGLKKVMSHDSYLINLGAPNPEILEKSRLAFREEIERCQQLSIDFLNFHPGAAITDSPSQCMDRICESVIAFEDVLADGTLRLLLECTAGQGSVVGSKFEELAYMIHKLEKHVKIGVCVDTCHAFVSGYDLCTTEACEATLKQFDRIVGLQHLYAFHFNDSVKGLGSRVDRHSSLGKGFIGLDCFRYLMTNPKTREIPKYLETPEGMPVWKEEIALLRKFASES